MLDLPGKYRGDDWMTENLEKLGFRRTLPEIYGLLHGCIAASRMVMPSRYFSLIFGEEGASFDTEKEANEFMGSLMALWNRIAGWNPDTEPFLRPAVFYPNTPEGLKARVVQYAGLITYFVKGLDLGETQEADFSEDALDALKSLSETQVFLAEYVRLVETDKTHKGIGESFEMIGKLEEVIGDCIARINIGLKPARMRMAEEVRQYASRGKETRKAGSEKIGRNEPCPCGSGKKYKKCCGLMH